MKLRRAWPAILIWVVFVIFDIVMVASYSFFSGLFPSSNNLIYSVAFTAIAVLVMSIATFLLCRLADSVREYDFSKRTPFRIIYGILAVLIIAGGFWYRVDILMNSAGNITGKMSLYENAMIGAGSVTPESDLLSIIYTALLKLVLFFTGNINSVPFYFQTVCFTFFVICGFITVYKLLGMLAALVFTAYVSFMPVFTPLFTGLEISTDALFMAMFGIELLLVALYLSGAYRGIYRSRLWIVWYILVGAAVGYMAYVDAGTVIMILPFLLAGLMLYGREITGEAKRFLFVIIGAVIVFAAMIMQEAGIGLFDRSLYNWGTYYLHNLNTFSTFWTYTDYKMIYLVTVIAMSGVIVGFWKNRMVEKISPWLLSMLLIFATVPFMGATRMNNQVFVTVYYAFILACVASLITFPGNEEGEDIEEVSEEDASLAEDGETADEAEEVSEEAEESAEENEEEFAEEPSEEPAEAPEEEPAEETEEEPAEEPEEEPADTKEAEEPKEGYLDEEDEANEESEEEPEPKKPEQPKERFVPEGMVLPEDDEDTDMTPHMKMPAFNGRVSAYGTVEKLKVGRPVLRTFDEIIGKGKDDFDIPSKPGDDFDV